MKEKRAPKRKSASTLPKPCHVAKGDIIICPGLAAVTEYDCRKGIRTGTYLNFKTGKEKHFFIVHSGDALKRGLVMNFCPFCGADIIGHIPFKKKDGD